MSYGYPDSGGYLGSYGGQGGYGGYPGGPPPPDPYALPPDKTSTIWALIVGCVSFLCCTTNLVAIILAAIALSKDAHEVETMDRLTRYAWISNIIHIVLIVLLIAFFAIMIVLDSSSY